MLKFFIEIPNFPTWQFFLHKYNLWYLWQIWALNDRGDDGGNNNDDGDGDDGDGDDGDGDDGDGDAITERRATVTACHQGNWE